MNVPLHLLGLIGASVDPLGPVDQNPDDIRQQTCRLVASNCVCRPSTADPSPAPPPSGGGAGSIIGFILTFMLWAMAFAVVVGLLYLVLRAIIDRSGGGRLRRKRRALKGADDSGDFEDLTLRIIDRSREPDQWRREADGYRQQGLFREALRCRYRALVGDLARRGLVDEIPGRTTGEERVQLRKVSEPVSIAFAAAADLFDDAWFGHVPVGLDEDDRFQQLEQNILQGVAGRRQRVALAADHG